MKPELKEIPVERLVKGKYQPRSEFNQESLAELAESINMNGLIQPIVVRKLNEDGYEIVAGERRWRAAQQAGLDTVPCLINTYSDEQAIAATTIENINRADLNPIEEAKAYQQFIDELDYLHEEIAAVVGKSRAHITNCLRLLRLDDRVQQLIIEEQLTNGHAKVIAGLVKSQQYEVAQKCAANTWSVRRLEQEAKRLQQHSAIQSGVDPNIIALEQKISDQVNSEVKIDTDLSKKSGWLKIKYYNPETLAGLLDKMGIKYEE